MKNIPPKAQDFKNELDKIFVSAQQEGKPYVDVKSGDLHRRVGGYPGPNHRMSVCCEAMRKKMKSGDQILREPPSGKGASLIILYKIPRELGEGSRKINDIKEPDEPSYKIKKWIEKIDDPEVKRLLNELLQSKEYISKLMTMRHIMDYMDTDKSFKDALGREGNNFLRTHVLSLRSKITHYAAHYNKRGREYPILALYEDLYVVLEWWHSHRQK